MNYSDACNEIPRLCGLRSSLGKLMLVYTGSMWLMLEITLRIHVSTNGPIARLCVHTHVGISIHCASFKDGAFELYNFPENTSEFKIKTQV